MKKYEAYREDEIEEAAADEQEQEGLLDDIEVVIGDSTISTRQPTQNPKSRRRREWERQMHRKRMLIALWCALFVLSIIGSIAWYLYSPIYGYGDLSENISAEMISKARSKFTVEQYFDQKEGVVLSYNIYIPYEYDRSKHYPLMLCIADSTSVGLDTQKPLDMNFGGAVWATDEMQAKHPCFVVVPCYPEKVTGSGVGHFTHYMDLTDRMIDTIVQKYNIPATEVYAAGQGMGASILTFLAADDPDRFNTILLIDGVPEIPDVSDLSRSRFISIAAGGDTDSLNAQLKMKEQLRAAGVAYGEIGEIDAGLHVDELNDAARSMLSKGCEQNFITWTKGSVGISWFFGEQRVSYRFGYKIDAVRDWIFRLTDNEADEADSPSLSESNLR